MNRFALMLMLLCVVWNMDLCAQVSNREEKAEINRIKKNNAYLSAEATLADKDEALALAEDLLYQQVNQYVASKKTLANAPQTATMNRKYTIEKVTLPRGNMYRAFLYVKKSDIIPVDNIHVTSGNKQAEQRENATFTQEMPVKTDYQREVINALTQVQKFNELSTLLPKLKREKKIAEYAKYSELRNPENFILIIYNREGEIENVLSEGDTDRYSLITGQSDSVSNYKGRGAIGVRLNETK